MKRLIAWLGAVAVAMLSTCAAASPHHVEKMDTLGEQLDSLEREFSVYSGNSRGASLEKRLQDGIIMQASGDHKRAEYIFMDIIAHEEWRGTPQYQAAQLQLSKSLYEDGYYRLSQRYLIDLLRTGVGSERTEGVLLLLQVAQRTGDWTEVNEALSDVTDFARNPAYLYIMGRAMFLQGEFDVSRTSLGSIGSDSGEWYVKAEYLQGVLDVIANDLDSAIARFEKVSNNTFEFRDADDVRSLAILARARIYYEQTLWGKAIECYRQISEKSRYFADVLYEMAWTHIRMEDYFAAQQKFELLLLSFPENSHALETRRLMADIKRELGQYDEALTSYQKIVDEFEPVMSEMEAEAAQLESRKVILQKSIEDEQYHNVHVVPERAKGLVSVGSDVGRIEVMINSLTESDANTEEADSIIAEINAALQSDESVRNLPEFQRYTRLADDIRINALLTGYAFTQENASLSEQIVDLAAEIKKLPRNAQEREIFAALQASERDERQFRLHKTKLQIDSLRHKTRILKSWMDSGRVSSMTQNERERIYANIADYEAQLVELEDSVKVIESSLARLRTSMALGTDDFAGETGITTFRYLLEQQWAADMPSADSEYGQLVAKERALLSRLDAFNGSVNTSIQNRVRDFRARLETEMTLLAAEKERYLAMKSDVGATAGEISARYWQSVYDQIRDMVLNADLGMVDIAWLKKDARSKALSETMDERKKEREVLEQDFKQFLKESGQE